MSALATQVEDTGGVYVVPAFTGLCARIGTCTRDVMDSMASDRRDALYAGWQKAITRALHWEDKETHPDDS